LCLNCKRWQGAGNFGEDFGLDGGADDLGDNVEYPSQRGNVLIAGKCGRRGLPFGGEVSAWTEFAERNIHFSVKAIHRFLTFKYPFFWGDLFAVKVLSANRGQKP
jgi:hypothetical protein